MVPQRGAYNPLPWSPYTMASFSMNRLSKAVLKTLDPNRTPIEPQYNPNITLI